MSQLLVIFRKLRSRFYCLPIQQVRIDISVGRAIMLGVNTKSTHKVSFISTSTCCRLRLNSFIKPNANLA